MFKGKEKNDSSHIKLENLIYIKKLGLYIFYNIIKKIKKGFGQFGSVFLVKNPEKNEFYALKCIAKNQILEQNLQRHLLVKDNFYKLSIKTIKARKRSHGKTQFSFYYAFFPLLPRL